MSTPVRVNRLAAAMKGMQTTDTATEPAPQAVQKERISAIAPARVGKKMISGFFTPEVSRQLRVMAVERDSSVQALLEEALNDLFRKHGKSAIA